MRKYINKFTTSILNKYSNGNYLSRFDSHCRQNWKNNAKRVIRIRNTKMYHIFNV